MKDVVAYHSHVMHYKLDITCMYYSMVPTYTHSYVIYSSVFKAKSTFIVPCQEMSVIV